MDSRLLAEALDFLGAHRDDYRVHRMVVLRHGYLVLDASFYPFVHGQRHDLASVTKSFTSTLVGIALDSGFIASVDQPVVSFFPEREIANLDDRKRAMTVEHLLTMRSGLACDPGSSEQTLREMFQSPDWVQFVLDLPMADEPGERWVYCSPAVHLLSAILEQATGLPTVDFARSDLFRPLGITDSLWLVDPAGTARGWGDLHLDTLDMAKLGQLFLNRGRWPGRRVVSSAWVERATTDDQGYGYLWFTSPELFSAQGRAGQLVFVLPGQDLVLALNAGGSLTGQDSAVVSELLNTHVLGAVRSDAPLLPDPAGVAMLEQRVSEAATSNEGPPQPVPTLPGTAWAISGRAYLFEPNPFGFSRMRLTFVPESDQALLEAWIPPVLDDDQLTVAIGLDGVSRLSPGLYGGTLAASGSWETDTLFAARVDALGLISLWRYAFAFDGDAVTVAIECLAGEEPSGTIVGTAE